MSNLTNKIAEFKTQQKLYKLFSSVKEDHDEIKEIRQKQKDAEQKLKDLEKEIQESIKNTPKMPISSLLLAFCELKDNEKKYNSRINEIEKELKFLRIPFVVIEKPEVVIKVTKEFFNSFNLRELQCIWSTFYETLITSHNDFKYKQFKQSVLADQEDILENVQRLERLRINKDLKIIRKFLSFYNVDVPLSDFIKYVDLLITYE